MKKMSLISKLCLATVLAASALSVGVQSATAAAQCPRPGIGCFDVWDPVICSNGKIYSNACYAYVACATGCVPYGDV